MSMLGRSSGPCSVWGCGVAVPPVIGLAFVGLSSGTLQLLAGLSKVFTAVILFAVTFGVAYFGWTVSAHSEAASRPVDGLASEGKKKKVGASWTRDKSRPTSEELKKR